MIGLHPRFVGWPPSRVANLRCTFARISGRCARLKNRREPAECFEARRRVRSLRTWSAGLIGLSIGPRRSNISSPGESRRKSALPNRGLSFPSRHLHVTHRDSGRTTRRWRDQPLRQPRLVMKDPADHAKRARNTVRSRWSLWHTSSTTSRIWSCRRFFLS
jgi:hypothetical protein